MAFDNFTTLPGGLHIAVAPLKGIDSESIYILKSALKYEAQTHGARFDRIGFGKVISAIDKGEIEVWFMRAAWNVCDAEGLENAKTIGVTLGYPYARIGNNLKAYDADYQEDTVFMSGVIRELIREKPANKDFPRDRGLMEIFEDMRMDIKRTNQSGRRIVGRAGEICLDNMKMVNMVTKSGAILGNGIDGLILELNDLMSQRCGQSSIPVTIEQIKFETESKPVSYAFLVRHENSEKDLELAFSFNKGRSTAGGGVVVRAQAKSRGDLSDSRLLKEVLNSILSAAQEEIEDRDWGKPDFIYQPHPRLSNNLDSRENVSTLWQPPPIRIHGLGEHKIMTALSEDLQVRKFGSNTMYASEQVWTETQRPLFTTPARVSGYAPQFGLAVSL